MKIKCPDCLHENIPGEETCGSCSGPLVSLSPSLGKCGLSGHVICGKVATLPPRKVPAVRSGTAVVDAVGLMRREKVRCVIVMDQDRLRGMLTDRDLLYSAARSVDLSACRVDDIMQVSPVILDADDPMSFACHHMAVGGYRVLPVRMSKDEVAAVTLEDLLGHFTSFRTWKTEI